MSTLMRVRRRLGANALPASASVSGLGKGANVVAIPSQLSHASSLEACWRVKHHIPSMLLVDVTFADSSCSCKNHTCSLAPHSTAVSPQFSNHSSMPFASAVTTASQEHYYMQIQHATVEDQTQEEAGMAISKLHKLVTFLSSVIRCVWGELM